MLENHSSELIEPISEYDCSRSLNSSAMNGLMNHLKFRYQIISIFNQAICTEWLRLETGSLYCLRELAKQAEERIDLLEELDTTTKKNNLRHKRGTN